MMFERKNYNKTKNFGAGKRRFVYSKKTYANPFFRRKKISHLRESGFLSNKIKLSFIALIVGSLIFIWLLFFSTLFKITKIEISGVGEGAAKEVESLSRQIAESRPLGKNNLLLYDTDELKKALNEKYYLQALDIRRKPLHTLKITLEEKNQIAVWREDDKYFYLDGDGSIIGQVEPLNINGARLPLIENLTGIKIESRKANIDKTTVDYALALFSEFKNKKHGFEIERFILDKDLNTIKLAVLSGPRIYFNLRETAAKQTERLDLIVKEKLKDDFMSKEYIDLRYGNNVYIK